MNQSLIDLTGCIENTNMIGEDAIATIKAINEDFLKSMNSNLMPFLFQFFYAATNPLLNKGSNRICLRRTLNARIERHLHHQSKCSIDFNTIILISDLKEKDSKKILKITIGFNNFSNENDTLFIFIVLSNNTIDDYILKAYMLFEKPTRPMNIDAIVRTINLPDIEITSDINSNDLRNNLLYYFYLDVISQCLNPKYDQNENLRKSVTKCFEESINELLSSTFGGSNTSILVKCNFYDLDNLTCEIMVSYITYDETNYLMKREDIDKDHIFYIHMDLKNREVKASFP